ncbi:hypothetical protein HYS50_02615 [Candidatus Woesearchaeota archaeon]|nr:hypothetical protein [Candidatus Woesearchaeota archaeon]
MTRTNFSAPCCAFAFGLEQLTGIKSNQPRGTYYSIIVENKEVAVYLEKVD